MLQIVGDIDAARNILLEAIERDKVRILTNEIMSLCVNNRLVASYIYLQLLGLELWLSGA